MLAFNDVFVGHLVILCLIVFITLRPVVKKQIKINSTSLFAPVAFSLILLHIFVFGLQILSIVILILVILSFCMNGPSLYRLSQQLYSHRYSNVFIVSSLFLAFLCILCVVFSIIFMPLPFNKENQIKTQYTGSLAQGFVQKSNLFDISSLVVTEWKPTTVEDDIAIVYLSPVGTTTYDSSLRLGAIAERGIPVISGDFYSNRVTGSFDRKLLIAKNGVDSSLLTMKEYELESLLEIAEKQYSSVIIITDVQLQSIAEKIAETNKFVVDVVTYEENELLKKYYGKNKADLFAMLPLESLLLYSSNWDEYLEFRNIAVKENPHEVFADVVLKIIKGVE